MKNVNVCDIVTIQRTSLAPDKLTKCQWVGSAIPGLQLIILILLLLKKVDEFIDKSEEYQAQLMICQIMYFYVKYIKNNENENTRQIATESHLTNAPPAGPPTDSIPAADLTAFYDFAISEISQNKDTQKITIPLEILSNDKIKFYIISKINQKAANYPEKLSQNFKNLEDFKEFDKNLKGEIYRQFLNVRRAARNYKPLKKSKLEPELEAAAIAYMDVRNNRTTSLSQKVSVDGKATELIDLIPSKSWETLDEANPRQKALFELEPSAVRTPKKKGKPKTAKGGQNVGQGDLFSGV